MNRRKYIIPLAIFVTTCIAATILFLPKHPVKKGPPYCLRLKEGNVSVEVTYGNDVVNHSYPVSIDLYNDNKKDGNRMVLDITAEPYTSVKQIVDDAKIEVGPDYEESTFNGHQAAFAHYDADTEGSWDYYFVPYGNRTFFIQYNSAALSAEQKDIGEKMLRSITFAETKDDVKDAYVEDCSK